MTLDQEIAVVWKRKLTVTSVLLLAARWLMLFRPITSIMPSTHAWCESVGADRWTDLMVPLHRRTLRSVEFSLTGHRIYHKVLASLYTGHACVLDGHSRGLV